ncbi:MAG TPA: protein-disulfide reductase DsbD domain-containing protein [Terriglobales bacterium]|nr:protein-disulfide reductase DsbD domain-containing protein [Terriglobales bacterium]
MSLVLVCVIGRLAAGAQGDDKAIRSFSAPDNVQFVTALPVAPIRVVSGKPAKITFRFKVEPGKHINSNMPRGEYLIATKLRLNPPTDVGIGQIAYPAGRDMSFQFAPKEILSVYTGEFSIGAVVSSTRRAAPGTFRVHGDLVYQACDDRACFPPKKLPIAFDVRVDRAPRQAAPQRNPAQSPHVHR